MLVQWTSQLTPTGSRVQSLLDSQQARTGPGLKKAKGGRKSPGKGGSLLGWTNSESTKATPGGKEGKWQSTRPGILGSFLHPLHPVLSEVEKCEDCANQSEQ